MKLLRLLALLVGCWTLATLATASIQDAGSKDDSRAGPDGPYVRVEQDGGWTVKRVLTGEKGPQLFVETRTREEPLIELLIQGHPYSVRLRPPDPAPAVEHPCPERLLALSDIEGNLAALVGLLRAANAVDAKLDWTFGKGHVVIVGDLFDRGLQVTECLWLLYELEARAHAAGGAVHFVLGNHEVMNLTGDLRYVRNKYRENATILGEELAALYTRETVLGHWLRTRNVAVRIGDELFVHGGISPAVAAKKPTLQQLSDTLRSALLADAWTKPVDGLLTMAAGSDGLIWYRGYIKEPVVTAKEMDGVLAAFAVKRVIVGHTLVERVGFAIGGRVLAIDVHHASVKSQAVIHENGTWRSLHLDGKRGDL